MSDFENRQRNYEKFTSIAYYLIIGLISLLATTFLPMLSSQMGLEWNLPNTSVGWAIYVITKLIVAAINMMLFYCFMEQAKVNVKDNANYKRANEILSKYWDYKKLKPRSPKKWEASQYLTKGTSIFIVTVLSAIGLSQAILTFDMPSFLTYAFTIVMGLVFGYMQMRKAESYWVNEYLEYALYYEKYTVKGEDENV